MAAGAVGGKGKEAKVRRNCSSASDDPLLLLLGLCVAHRVGWSAESNNDRKKWTYGVPGVECGRLGVAERLNLVAGEGEGVHCRQR